MRLSDVKGDRVLDVVADIIEPIANIAEDEKAAALFKREVRPDGETANSYAIKRLKKGVPPLIRGHKEDIIAIMAAIEGVTPKEYAAGLDLLRLIKDFTELITDQTFLGLFTSAQTQE